MKKYTLTTKLVVGIMMLILIQAINTPRVVNAGIRIEQSGVHQQTGKVSRSEDINPVPSIQLLSPDHTKSGGLDFMIQVQGQGFITDTVVSWNSLVRPTTYISSTFVSATIYSSDINSPGVAEVFVTNPSPGGGDSNKLIFQINPHLIFSPIVDKYFPPIPFIPSLSPIDNSGLNNIYTVYWSSASFAEAYRLEEAIDPGFINVTDVFDGVGNSWSTQYPGKAPGTYYYRVQSYNIYGSSSWSTPQAVTVYPPGIPILYVIENSAQNNTYFVSWNTASFATGYRLQEATDSNFTNIVQVYEGTGLIWTTPNPGKAPGTYYYRVQSFNGFGPGAWSIPQAITVYPPGIPILYVIENPDQNNTYFVSWSIASFASGYRLQEATDSNFTNIVQVYDGTGLIWTTPDPGKFPGTYYYRVQSYNYFGPGAWSIPQAVTIYPLFVGLKLGFDGNGYVRGNEYYDIGYHQSLNFDALTEPDTIRLNGYFWYDPDPIGFGDGYWTSYYSVITGQWKGSSSPGDPYWKWSDPWFLPYTLQLSNNKTVLIDNQPFTVKGPYTGVTSWGHSIQYWELVNQKRFLIWSDGGDWAEYVYLGEAILRYDAGSSRLLLYDDVKRHEYYKGKVYSETVEYIMILTSSTSIPGSTTSPAFPESAFNSQDTNNQNPRYPSKGMVPFWR